MMPAMDGTTLFAFLLLAGVAALVAGLAVHLRAQRRIHALEQDKVRLGAELENERRLAAEKLASLEQARDQVGKAFDELAREALRHNSSEFLRLAQENLRQFQVRAQGELAQREQAVEGLVKPIREALEKTERQLHNLEKERVEAQGSLRQHLESLVQAQNGLQAETRRLSQALHRPEVRGQWGEMTLKRLAELAGMVEHCDFFEQQTVDTDQGRMRPDMLVRLPDRREIVVDAKTPLDAYLGAVEASDEAERTARLAQHARNVRERVKELAAKSYWQQFQDSPDFVVLFIPGEQFLSSALEVDPRLLEDALASQVVLATPTSFVALLRAVAYGWRQELLAENAEQIRHEGKLLYDRLVTFAEHLGKLGKSLDSSVKHFNKAVGSFDSRVLPVARKFTEMGISARKPLADGQQIETAPRNVEGLADDEAP